MNILLIAFISIFALIIIVSLTFFLIARSKGRIKFILNSYNFSAGETLRGKIHLTVKKPLENTKLIVGLIGTSRKIRSNRNDERESKFTFYEFFQPLNENEFLNPGEYEYDFEIKIPNQTTPNSTGNAIMDTLVKSTQILTRNEVRVDWKLQAILECSGVNIREDVRVNIA